MLRLWINLLRTFSLINRSFLATNWASVKLDSATLSGQSDLALKFWVRALTSLAVVLLAVVSWAEPFGRYGYQAWPAIEGFQFEPDGFRVSDPVGDKFSFLLAMKEVKPKRINWQEAV